MAKHHKKNDPNLTDEAQRYEHPVPSREFILDYLKKEGRPVSREKILADLELTSDNEQEGIRRRLIAMVRDGQLISNRQGSYALVDRMHLVKGVIQGHRDGFGFLIPDQGEGDIFLPAREMQSVFTDDVVLVRVTSKRGSRSEGTIVEVLERGTKELVGRFFRDGDVAFVQPEARNIAQDVLVVDEGGVAVHEGDYVLVSIVSQPTKRRHATSAIIERLGDARESGMEARLAAYSHGIPVLWPEGVQEEAEKVPQTVDPALLGERLDLRDKAFVTIDGADAKDFDDAVLAEPHRRGGWTLWVAIADVAEYVKPDTALDTEAFNRGNSVYFPNDVIPMLPERLSNGMCSLNPDVDRLVLVCEMRINEAGKVSKSSFHEGVIHSHARLTYTQAGIFMTEGGTHAQGEHLNNLYAVYKVLDKQRKERGTIEFEVDEPVFNFDENGKIESIGIASRTVAHKVIEEAMLAANVCAAKFLEKNKMPFLYRIHSSPDVEKLKNLREFLTSFSLSLSGRNTPTAKNYSKLMAEVKKRDDAHLIQTVVLRSMQQAVYSPDSIGHFGLAYDSYSHFTSPIRRYPDLLVHRAIKHIVRGQKAKKFAYDKADYPAYGEHLSVTERRADRASRDAMDRLKCEFMEDKLGQTFDARIVDVTGFGIFVECHAIYVQGLIHISALDNDYYDHDMVNHCLRGKRSGKVYRLGDKVRVLVSKVDIDERKIDFVLG